MKLTSTELIIEAQRCDVCFRDEDFFESYIEALVLWFSPFDQVASLSLKAAGRKPCVNFIAKVFPVQMGLIISLLEEFPAIERWVINSVKSSFGSRNVRFQVVAQEIIEGRYPIVRIEDEDGKTYFLKNHHPEPGNLFSKLVEALGVSNEAKPSIPRRVFSADDYIIEENVVETLDLNADFGNFSYSCVVLTAVSQWLGARDMHYSNVRASDSRGLIVLDTETLFHGVTQDHKIPNLKSTLLFGNLANGKNYSGVTAILIRAFEQSCNSLLFVKELCEVYRFAWNAIINNQDVLCNILEACESSVYSRSVLRSTSFYYQLIYKHIMCSVWNIEEARRQIIGALNQHSFHLNESNVMDYEVNSLMAGKVPSFYTTLNSTDLQFTGGLVADFYLTPSISSISLRSEYLKGSDIISANRELKQELLKLV